MTTVVSLRKFSRTAPELAEAVQIRHADRIIGEFTPAPRGAQEGGIVATPARPGAPVKRAASVQRSKAAPTGASTFSPAPKPGSKR